MTGQQGRAGGFADPDDVEVNLQGQDSAWGEENDILTYVQSKVSLGINLAHLDTGCILKLYFLMHSACLHLIACHVLYICYGFSSATMSKLQLYTTAISKFP